MVFFVSLGEAQIQYSWLSRLQEKSDNRRRAIRGEKAAEGDENPHEGCSPDQNKPKDR